MQKEKYETKIGQATREYILKALATAGGDGWMVARTMNKTAKTLALRDKKVINPSPWHTNQLLGRGLIEKKAVAPHGGTQSFRYRLSRTQEAAPQGNSGNREYIEAALEDVLQYIKSVQEGMGHLQNTVALLKEFLGR